MFFGSKRDSFISIIEKFTGHNNYPTLL